MNNEDWGQALLVGLIVAAFIYICYVHYAEPDYSQGTIIGKSWEPGFGYAYVGRSVITYRKSSLSPFLHVRLESGETVLVSTTESRFAASSTGQTIQVIGSNDYPTIYQEAQ